MTITVCDFCKKQGDDRRMNRWVEIRYGSGPLVFFHGPNRRIELCDDCFDKLTNGPA